MSSTAKLTPVGAYAEQLVEAGVPLGTIVTMIETHYAETVASLEAQLKEALVGTLHVEAMRDALAKQTALNEDLAQRVSIAVDRANALQSFERPRPAPEPASSPLSDEALLDLADQQSKPRTRGPLQPTTSEKNLAARINFEQLTRQLDSAKAELQQKSIALEKERAMRRKLESTNHTLNMHALAMHDDASRTARDLEAAKTRLREQTQQFDRDRQSLVSALADAKSELTSTTHRCNSQVEALTQHLGFVEKELTALRKAHSELHDDYIAATHHGNAVDESVASMRSPLIGDSSGPRALNASSAEAQQHRSAVQDLVLQLQGALDQASQRADRAEAEVAQLRSELEAARSSALVPGGGTAPRPHLLSIAASPEQQPRCIMPAARTPEPSRQAETHADASPAERAAPSKSSTPPPALRTEPGDGPSWSASQQPLRPRPAGLVAPRPQGSRDPPQKSLDGFRKGADQASLMRLRGPPTVVSIEGAKGFVAQLTPSRLTLKPRPHRGNPLPALNPDAADGAGSVQS